MGKYSSGITLEILDYRWRLCEAWMRPADRALVLDCHIVYAYAMTTAYMAAVLSLVDETNGRYLKATGLDCVPACTYHDPRGSRKDAVRVKQDLKTTLATNKTALILPSGQLFTNEGACRTPAISHSDVML